MVEGWQTLPLSTPVLRTSQDSLVKRFDFVDYGTAFSFVEGTAQHAAAVDHHPELILGYNQVTVLLTTHDTGGISGRDRDFASWLDQHWLDQQPAPAS